jgi:geranylgeranyl pyrophosphate synthase
MGKTLKSDIMLGKKTFLMIQALGKNGIVINHALKTAQTDFKTGIEEIRSYMEKEGIREKTKEEIDLILNLANEKLNNLSIDKEKLFYFSELIKKRGH